MSLDATSHSACQAVYVRHPYLKALQSMTRQEQIKQHLQPYAWRRKELGFEQCDAHQHMKPWYADGVSPCG